VFQLRIPGRGGKGVLAAAESIPLAVCPEAGRARTLACFPAPRMGARRTAYSPTDDQEIRLRDVGTVASKVS
jgi:Pyruvate/2-oxoacid:ferredoxin oxidoreductase gamma subunit